MTRRAVSVAGVAAVTAGALLPLAGVTHAAAGLLCGSPSISGVSGSAFAGVGGTVTVSGSGLDACNASVTVGGVAEAVASRSSSQLTVTLQNRATGPVLVTLSTVGESDQTNATVVVASTPTVSTSGTLKPRTGAAMTLSGSGFAQGGYLQRASATACGVALPVTVNSDSQLTVTAPGQYCQGTIQLAFAVYTDTAHTSTFSVPVAGPAIDVAPNVTAGIPSSVPAGGTVTVSGTGFGTAGSVGGGAWTLSSWSDTAISVSVPDSATSATMTLTRSADHTVVQSSSVTVGAGVASVSPQDAAVGDTVTVQGSGFATPGSVTAGSTSLSIQSWSPTTIIATVPSGAPPGSAVLTVTPQGNAPATASLTIVPKVTGTNPTHAGAGALFEIDGTSFGSQQGSVTVGGTAAQVTLWGDTSIVVAMPSGLRSGTATITVSVPGVPSVTGSVTVDPASSTGGGGSVTLSTSGSTPGSSASASPGATPGFIPPSASGPIIASGPVDFKPQKQSGPVQLTLQPGGDSGDPGSDIPFTVTLSAFGKPVVGAAVDLLLVVVPGTDATITPTHAVTDASGQVKGTLHLSRRSGDHIVLARSGQYSDEVRIVGRGASDAAPAVATGRGSDGGAIAAATGSPQRMLIIAALVACLVLFLTGFVLNLATSPGPSGAAGVRGRGPMAAVFGGARSALAIAQVGLAAGALAVGAVVGRLRR